MPDEKENPNAKDDAIPVQIPGLFHEVAMGIGLPQNPYNWYWKHDDGRIYSSASQSYVKEDDKAYKTWLNMFAPTPWPRDEKGKQSVDVLREVLKPYNRNVP